MISLVSLVSSYLVKRLAMRHDPSNVSKKFEDGPTDHGYRKCDELPRPYCLHQKEDEGDGEESGK